MGFWNAVMPYVQVLLPTITLALIFWFVMKSVFGADRREREAEAKAAAEYDERIAARAQQLRSEGGAAGAGGTGTAGSSQMPDATPEVVAESPAGEARGDDAPQR